MKKGRRKQVFFIIGPTASGKSQLSILLAEKCRGEIVSADSRQVYRYMDIGTAKPTTLEREKIFHHCIDIKNPDEFFSAGEYAILARRIVSEILSRGPTPIVVGGSGLYIRALVDGVFFGDYRDKELRDRLKRQAEEKGLDSLYNRLCELDPDACCRIHPNDQKRIIRALEVCELSGRPITSIQNEKTVSADFFPCFWGLRWSRDVLYQRIEKRVDDMVRSGLVQEVEKLKKMGFGLQHNSLDSVGYKEIFNYLDERITLEEAVTLIKRNTRGFAKRQMTWFRQDKRIQWIDIQEPVDWEGVVEVILE